MFLIRNRFLEITLSFLFLMEERYCYERGQFNITESLNLCNGGISNGSKKITVNGSHCKDKEDTMDLSEEEELWQIVLDKSQLFMTIIGKQIAVVNVVRKSH